MGKITKDNLVKFFEFCLVKLNEDYENNPYNYETKADFHFELYHLLNMNRDLHENNIVCAEYCIEDNKTCSIVLYNPEIEGKKEPFISAEVIYDGTSKDVKKSIKNLMFYDSNLRFVVFFRRYGDLKKPKIQEIVEKSGEKVYLIYFEHK